VKKQPTRTCLGCRQVRPQGALVRVVRLANGTVVADTGTHATGRGAYVCPDGRCVERGLSRARLSHAFKKASEAAPDLAAVVRACARAEAPVADAREEVPVLYAVAASAIGDVDVITVRS
jgi:predicted RNA-binding protein YlxR (DUF448 family)